MILAKRIRGRAMAAMLGPVGESVRQLAQTASQRIRRQPDVIDFYFDLVDPWSYLAAQAMDRLAKAYSVPFNFHYISPPASDVNPLPVPRSRHAVRDAHELAAYYNVSFFGRKELEAGALRRVGSALISPRPPAEQLACALELGTLLWAGDPSKIPPALRKYEQEAQISIPTVTNANYEALRKRGHYQGAMFAFRGQWYWGIDRLDLLEEALSSALGTKNVGVVSVRPESERGPLRLAKGDGPVPVDFWFSFDSPYSYLAVEKIESTLRGLPAKLVMRPVAPMRKRGIPLPNDKRTYVARDVKRCADRLGIPFGNMCESPGKGVDNCLAIAKLAESQGKALPFARSALRGVWAEARDLSEYVDLRRVVERAGLDWNQAKAALQDPAGAATAVINADEMDLISLWGVPSMRAGDFITWGHDRLPLLADRLRRHAAEIAINPTPPPAAVDGKPEAAG